MLTTLTYQNKTDRLVSWICRLLKIDREYYHDAVNYKPGDYSLGKWKKIEMYSIKLNCTREQAERIKKCLNEKGFKADYSIGEK